MRNLLPTHVKGDPKVLRKGPRSLSSVDRTARALGWFSIGLGFVEMLAPKAVTRSLGMESRAMDATVRVFGAREIGAGLLTLSTEKKLGLWARVVGDTLDMAVLSNGLKKRNPKQKTVKVALTAVLGITLLDAAAAWAVTRRTSRPRQIRDYSDRSGFPHGLVQSRARQIQSTTQHVH